MLALDSYDKLTITPDLSTAISFLTKNDVLTPWLAIVSHPTRPMPMGLAACFPSRLTSVHA